MKKSDLNGTGAIPKERPQGDLTNPNVADASTSTLPPPHYEQFVPSVTQHTQTDPVASSDNPATTKRRPYTRRTKIANPGVTLTEASPTGHDGLGAVGPINTENREEDLYSNASSYISVRNGRSQMGDNRGPYPPEYGLPHPTAQHLLPPPTWNTPVNGPRREARTRVMPQQDDFRFSDEDVDHRADRPLSAVALLHTMKRWDLSFSGKRGEDVEDFLMRIDEGRAFLPIRDNELLRAIPFFLRGAALIWYRGHTQEFATWEIAKSAFRHYYGDPDYQIALREEITDRTQAEGERVGEFIACMRGLFSRTSPRWSDREQVRYTHRNLLPDFRVAIPISNDTTMDELELSAIRHEKILESASTRRPPPKPEHSLCPSFAYRGPATSFRPNRRPFFKNQAVQEHPPEGYEPEETEEAVTNECLEAAREPHPKLGKNGFKKAPKRVTASGNPASPLAWQGVLPPPAANPGRNPGSPRTPVGETRDTVRPQDPPAGNSHPPKRTGMLCYNCQKPGHRHRDCSEPRRLFCYRCSYSGVTTQNCPFCNPGNEIGGA